MSDATEQEILDGLGFTPERLEMINWYVTMRGNGIVPALRELINEGLFSILQIEQANQAAKAEATRAVGGAPAADPAFQGCDIEPPVVRAS
jgi:hypothetical protein